MHGTIARIALNLSLDRFFDYRIPDHLVLSLIHISEPTRR